ncbi:hypothetical protein D3C71_1655440 [compost metagenome]
MPDLSRAFPKLLQQRVFLAVHGIRLQPGIEGLAVRLAHASGAGAGEPRRRGVARVGVVAGGQGSVHGKEVGPWLSLPRRLAAHRANGAWHA